MASCEPLGENLGIQGFVVVSDVGYNERSLKDAANSRTIIFQLVFPRFQVVPT